MRTRASPTQPPVAALVSARTGRSASSSGRAFNKVVNSIVINDILMPPIGLLIGGVEFKHLELIVHLAQTATDGAELPTVALRYGLLVNSLIESWSLP